jgi:DmsE family decaheme c-type cytochrome
LWRRSGVKELSVIRHVLINRLAPATIAAAALAFGFALADTATVRAEAGKPQQAPAAATPDSGYVGDDTCLTCHTDQTVKGTAHGEAANPRTPAAQHGCESCHGPGKAHVDDDAKGHIKKFAQMAPRDVSPTCVTCHNRGDHMFWAGSQHDARGLGCTTCHSVHKPMVAKGQLKAKDAMSLCATCHKVQVQKTQRTAHMPVREGKMTCVTCHNPHGSSNVKQLRAGNYVNESCFTCHAEKRGPFLWDHAAGREACSSCHDPHGSTNDRMLVAKQPMLCQRCHIGTRHPSTIYDGTALANRSNRLVERSCTNCHQQIHGSNHPSGMTFLR